MVYALSLGLSFCEFNSHQSYYCTYSLSGKTLVHGTNDISSTLIRCFILYEIITLNYITKYCIKYSIFK